MSLRPLPGEGEALNLHYPVAMVVLARSGWGQRWYTSGGLTRTLYTAPRMFDLYGAGHHVDHARWAGVPGEVLAIQLPAGTVGRLLQPQGAEFTLPTRQEIFDDELNLVVEQLWCEALAGSPHGQLYVQGLTLALLGLLMHKHGGGPAASARRIACFSRRERERLRTLMHEELAGDLSVERLAEAVNMSPDHFARVFKASFQRPPHAYVLDLRIQAAAQSLRAERTRSVADIAGSVGFSSQSHFTEVFRRKLGTTPVRWRSGN